MTRRRSLLLAPLLAATPALAQPVAGGRTVRVVVPFPPGGAIDLLGRLVAERLGPALGQDVVVENRGGAGGILGTDAVAKGPKDGTVIGVIGGATLTAYPTLYNRLPFDPLRDLQPLTQITTGALICVVNAEEAARRGWTDFRALIAWSKANPDRVKMGSSGPGTSSHLCPGMGEFADLGLGELDIVAWNALMVASGTPAPVVERLLGAIRQVAADPGLVGRLRPLGYEVVLSESPAALSAQVERETPVWRRLVEMSGVKLD